MFFLENSLTFQRNIIGKEEGRWTFQIGCVDTLDEIIKSLDIFPIFVCYQADSWFP